jgi:rubrerythrin
LSKIVGEDTKMWADRRGAYLERFEAGVEAIRHTPCVAVDCEGHLMVKPVSPDGNKIHRCEYCGNHCLATAWGTCPGCGAFLL